MANRIARLAFEYNTPFSRCSNDSQFSDLIYRQTHIPLTRVVKDNNPKNQRDGKARIIVMLSNEYANQLTNTQNLAQLKSVGLDLVPDSNYSNLHTVYITRAPYYIKQAIRDGTPSVYLGNRTANISRAVAPSNSSKIFVTFSQADDAREASLNGCCINGLSVESHYINMAENTYIPQCKRCYTWNEHPSNQCPLPPGAQLCSRCIHYHSYKQCLKSAANATCRNCGGNHEAVNPQCPDAKKALQLIKGKITQASKTFAQNKPRQTPQDHQPRSRTRSKSSDARRPARPSSAGSVHFREDEFSHTPGHGKNKQPYCPPHMRREQGRTTPHQAKKTPAGKNKSKGPPPPPPNSIISKQVKKRAAYTKSREAEAIKIMPQQHQPRDLQQETPHVPRHNGDMEMEIDIHPAPLEPTQSPTDHQQSNTINELNTVIENLKTQLEDAHRAHTELELDLGQQKRDYETQIAQQTFSDGNYKASMVTHLSLIYAEGDPVSFLENMNSITAHNNLPTIKIPSNLHQKRESLKIPAPMKNFILNRDTQMGNQSIILNPSNVQESGALNHETVAVTIHNAPPTDPDSVQVATQADGTLSEQAYVSCIEQSKPADTEFNFDNFLSQPAEPFLSQQPGQSSTPLPHNRVAALAIASPPLSNPKKRILDDDAADYNDSETSDHEDPIPHLRTPPKKARKHRSMTSLGPAKTRPPPVSDTPATTPSQIPTQQLVSESQDYAPSSIAYDPSKVIVSIPNLSQQLTTESQAHAAEAYSPSVQSDPGSSDSLYQSDSDSPNHAPFRSTINVKPSSEMQADARAHKYEQAFLKQNSINVGKFTCPICYKLLNGNVIIRSYREHAKTHDLGKNVLKHCGKCKRSLANFEFVGHTCRTTKNQSQSNNKSRKVTDQTSYSKATSETNQ